MTEHGAEIPQTLRCVVREAVFDRRTHHGRRIFRTQRQFFTIHRIFKGIHFLFNDVGHFTDAARKKGGRFQNRRTDLPVTVARSRGTHRIRKFFPDRTVFGKHIGHSLDARHLHFCHGFVLS